MVMHQRQVGDNGEGCGDEKAARLGLVVGLPLATAVKGTSFSVSPVPGKETARVPAARWGAEAEGQGQKSPQRSPATSHYPEWMRGSSEREEVSKFTS